MSIFAVSDDGGTGFGEGNVKANIDFASANGLLDVLADRLYVARDRTLVASNHTVNVTGDLTIGRGTVDVNTAILGFQEHVGKTNWYALDSTQPDNAYLGYCRGTLVVTNGGTFNPELRRKRSQPIPVTLIRTCPGRGFIGTNPSWSYSNSSGKLMLVV